MGPAFLGYTRPPSQPSPQGPSVTAAALNVRVDEVIYPQEAPDPIRQGDTPSRWAQNQVATFQNIASIQSVMENNFGWGFDLWAPVHTAAENVWLGGHSNKVLPMTERINIRRNPSVPYGSVFELSTDQKMDLLMGRS